MQIIITANEQLQVGSPTVIDGNSPDKSFAAVFEDDGDTGYFYAVDTSLSGQQIQDALHIYNTVDVSGWSIPSEVKIGWSTDSSKVVLLINGSPHAVFDFDSKRGYCLSGFPPTTPDGKWSKFDHTWSEDVLKLFA